MNLLRNLIFALTMAMFVGCTPIAPQPDPLYSNGDIVCSVISGQKGQVLMERFRYAEYYYDVRFEALQTSATTSLLGGKAPVQHLPLARVDNMREYELTECSN